MQAISYKIISFLNMDISSYIRRMYCVIARVNTSFTIPLPSDMSRRWTQTLNHEIARQAFYHCIISAGHVKIPLFANFSPPLSVPMVGFKPSSSRWWGKFSTTVLPPLPMLKYNFLPFFHYQYQCERLDSNPQPWDNEVSALPLCYLYPPCVNTSFAISSPQRYV